MFQRVRKFMLDYSSVNHGWTTYGVTVELTGRSDTYDDDYETARRKVQLALTKLVRLGEVTSERRRGGKHSKPRNYQMYSYNQLNEQRR